MFERPCADVTSIEEMVSQKSASDLWVSAYPLQEKGWKPARGASFVGHAGSSGGGSVTSGGAAGGTTGSSRLIYPYFTPLDGCGGRHYESLVRDCWRFSPKAVSIFMYYGPG